MRSLREGVYSIVGMTGSCVAGSSVCGSVTASATLEGTLMVCYGGALRWKRRCLVAVVAS